MSLAWRRCSSWRPYLERTSPLEREQTIAVFSNPAYMTLADGGKGNARLGIRYQLTMAWLTVEGGEPAAG